MSKPLSPEQLAYLRSLRDGGPRKGSARGLIARSLVAYRWGQDPTMGYTLTPKGRRVLDEADK